MINPETLKREKTLFAYTSALERGDFARLELILETAGSDAILERQIMEINTALSQPRAAASSPAAPKIPLVKLWQRIKSSLSGLFATPFRNSPFLRPMAMILAGSIIVLIAVMALLGPAVGKVFSNVVTSLPSSAYQDYPVLATQTVSGRETESYRAYPFPLSGQQLISQPASQPDDRLIVRNGSLIVVANDTRQARQSVLEMVAEFAAEGAFVVNSFETYPYNNPMPEISMALRVPVNRYDESMTRLANLGVQVLNRSETAQDVTQDYVDTTARIQALEISRARLIEIIKEAKNTDDLLRAEQELSRREAELEAAKARQQYLATTAALSSISVELRPAPTSQPVTDKGWDPAATLHNAVRSLLATLRSFADGAIFFVITTLPWLVVIALLIFGLFRLFRRKGKK